MALKIFKLKLKDKDSPFSNQRKVDHLFRKYCGVRVSLGEAIDVINAVRVGKEVEVLFNTNNLEEIKVQFLKYSVIVLPKE